MNRVEGRVVDQKALGYINQVNALLISETGVTIHSLQTDLKDFPSEVGEVAAAQRKGVEPRDFVSRVVAALDLAPAASFASEKEASAVNMRRVALVTLSREDPAWVRVDGDHRGAIFRDTPEGVERLSVVPSKDGKWGWGLAFAEGASIEADLASRGRARLSGNAEFRHVSSGLDIKCVVPEVGCELVADTSGPSI